MHWLIAIQYSAWAKGSPGNRYYCCFLNLVARLILTHLKLNDTPFSFAAILLYLLLNAQMCTGPFSDWISLHHTSESVMVEGLQNHGLCLSDWVLMRWEDWSPSPTTPQDHKMSDWTESCRQETQSLAGQADMLPLFLKLETIVKQMLKDTVRFTRQT